MKKFPHLVQMHEKHKKDGLEIISLTVDPPEAKDDVLAFLREVNATYTNLLLDEAPEVWGKKLRVSAFPYYYVFDRQGRWTMFGEDTIDYKAMDAFIVRLLKE